MRTGSLLLVVLLAACSSIPPKYAEGEWLIAQRFQNHPQFNGETVLVKGFGWRWIKGGNTLRVYEIETSDGSRLAAQEFQLRRQD